MLKSWPMLKSLLWKEFRETLPLAIIALATQGILWGFALDRVQKQQYAAVVFPFFYMLDFLFPIALGVWQISRESLGNHYQFLLHRLLDRRAIVGTKLLFGAMVCLLAVVVPLVFFKLWIRHQQNGPGEPFGMFPFCCNLFLLYLAAFLSALRPSLWYGSKFLPLLGAILLFIALQTVAEVLQWWTSTLWLSTLTLAPLIEICFVIAIFHVSQSRDYA